MKKFKVSYKVKGVDYAIELKGNNVDEIKQYCAMCLNGDVTSIEPIIIINDIPLTKEQRAVLIVALYQYGEEYAKANELISIEEIFNIIGSQYEEENE